MTSKQPPLTSNDTEAYRNSTTPPQNHASTLSGSSLRDNPAGSTRCFVSSSALDIITNPQDFHAHPTVLQSSWADLKAQRGQPITHDRMDRLHPAYVILPDRAALLLPTPDLDATPHSPAQMARVIRKVKAIARAKNYHLGPYGGDAA
jgi:hypothetical protein